MIHFVQGLKQNKILAKWENGEMGNWRNEKQTKWEMAKWETGEMGIINY
jgi:hypothetical protein